MKTKHYYPRLWQLLAMVEGRLTRLIVPIKPQPYCPRSTIARQDYTFAFTPLYLGHGETIVKMPFQEGDKVVMREVFGIHRDYDPDIPPKLANVGRGFVGYRADGSGCPSSLINLWRPATIMPDWAARFVVTIKSVEAMQLQKIPREHMTESGISWPIDEDDEGGFINQWDTDHKPCQRWADNPYCWSFGVEVGK